MMAKLLPGARSGLLLEVGLMLGVLASVGWVVSFYLTHHYLPQPFIFDTIGQLALRPRTGKYIRHPDLHGFEKARDAATNFRILSSQFHGCGHQQASAPTVCTARAVNVAGKVGPQAVDRLSAGVEFDVHPSQGIGNVAIKRTQEERVLVTESGVKAATRELRRTKKVRQRRGVITARPEHSHRAFDSGFRVETSGAATRQRHWALAAHRRYIRPIGL